MKVETKVLFNEDGTQKQVTATLMVDNSLFSRVFRRKKIESEAEFLTVLESVIKKSEHTNLYNTRVEITKSGYYKQGNGLYFMLTNLLRIGYAYTLKP